MKLTTSSKNYRALKVQIAAKYAGVKLTENIVANVDRFGKLETDTNTVITNSTTAALYVANDQLLGGSDKAVRALVQQYTWTAENELFDNVMAWVLPATGLSKRQELVEVAKAKVTQFLNTLNKELTPRTFLAGERISIADIAVATALLPAFQYVLCDGARKNIPKVVRWFNTIVNQKEFVDVVGKVELCVKIPQLSAADAKKAAAPAKKAEAKKPEAESALDICDELSAAPKEKDPFAKYPKGTFDFDDFKRVYSNSDCDKSIPYFWEKLDKANYSLWYCEYKYPEDLTQIFMSCNLISGMMQRLDKMRKNSFGSMILFGEDNKSTISGVWVWKGHDLAFELSSDWQIDFNSYNWKKLDAEDAKTKTLVQEYFSWEGNFDGKKFNQGKIFK